MILEICLPVKGFYSIGVEDIWCCSADQGCLLRLSRRPPIKSMFFTEQIYSKIQTNTFDNLDKYAWADVRLPSRKFLLKKIFKNSHKYILQFVQICLSRRLPIKSRLFHWTNIFQNSDKYILQFWEIAWADVCPVSFSLSNFGSSFRDCRGQAW